MSSSVVGGLFVPSRKGSAMPFLTGDEKQRYDKTFLSLLPPGVSKSNQLLGGEKVKEVFLKSGLPAKTLGLIWEKSDLTKDGKLDEKEFAIAMCLIEHVLGGHTVPSSLPQQLINMNVHNHSPAIPSSQQSTAAAPGGPPPKFTSDPFGGFGNSFIPGAPVAGPMTGAETRPGPMLPLPAHNVSGFPPATAPPTLPTMPPPLHPGSTAAGSSNIDAAFGGEGGGGKLYPTLPPAAPPAIPMRNDAAKSMTLSGPGGATGFDAFQVDTQQPVPPRRDSLSMKAAAVANSTDWMVPPTSRSKYRQQFALNDPGRTGIMGSNLARNILLQTNVDTNILARIWDLSNLRGQGNLNPDEFTLAMHLCEMVKAGEPLPSTLPPLLIPPSLRDQKINAFGVPVGPVPVPGAAGVIEASAEQPPQKQPMPVSFEDKLRQNFDRGEQALEEKRKALMEQERREKEERMIKERQEEERRTRERAEQERKKAEQWAEQQRRMEEVRKEAEAKAQAEHDRRIALNLESRIASARSQMTQLRSQNSQLDSDIQVLAAKKRSLDEQLIETKSSEEAARNSVKDRSERCFKKKKHLEQLQLQLQEFQRTLKQYMDKKISINEQLKQSTRHPIAERHSQVMASLDAQKSKVQRLKQQVEAAEKETADKFHRIDQLNVQISQCKTLIQNQDDKPQTQPMTAANNDFTTKSALDAASKPRRADSSGDAFGGGAGGTGFGVNNSSDPFASANAFSAQNGADNFFQSVSSAASVDPAADPFASTTMAGSDPFKAEDLFCTTKKSSSNAAFGIQGEIMERNINHTTNFNLNKQQNTLKMSTSTSFAATSEDTTVLSSSTVPATAETATVSEVYFEAIYDFATSDEGDLPFKAGDIIAASAQQNLEEPWLAGFLNGVGGWFPQNYTRRLDSKPSAAVSTSQPQQNLFSGQLSSTNAANGGASNASANFTSTVTTTDHNQFNHKSSSLTQFSSSTSSSAAASPQILCKVRANYPFEATAEGDLGLAAGDTVCVTSKDGDWWTGFLSTDPNSTSGIFPSNFVEVIQTFPTMAASSATGLSQAATTPQTLTLPTVSDAGAGTGKPGQELASVIAEFHGDSPEQLNLSVGDVIIVKKKLDSGWWEGQIQGEKKKGWFPGDYVRLISSGLTPIASANSSPERKAPGTAERVRAQFAFTAERDDELTFNVGDVINILCKDDNDWWTGELRGKSGLFPSNFVSPL